MENSNFAETVQINSLVVTQRHDLAQDYRHYLKNDGSAADCPHEIYRLPYV
jgi:hypothetical protein